MVLPRRIIKPVPEAYRTMPEPWRVMVVKNGNDPRCRQFDPWLHVDFVNQSEDTPSGFEIVGIDAADQLGPEEAMSRLAEFAGASIKDAFLLIPPDGLDFDAAYKPAEIIEGIFVNAIRSIE